MNQTLQNIISEEKLHTRYSDLDFDKSLKPYSLLNFFQDIASDNAQRLGFGYSSIYPKNLMWVLLKYRIEFLKYPEGIQNYILKTEPRGYNKLFAYRNFELILQNEVIAKASSMWTLLNFKDRSLVNIENVIQNNPYFGKFVPKESDLKYSKIQSLSKIDAQREFVVRYNDLDVNCHANNGNYIIWALEPINYNYRMEHRLKNIDMVFKKEAKFNDTILSCVEFIDDNTTLHVLKHLETKEDLCFVKCEWNCQK